MVTRKPVPSANVAFEPPTSPPYPTSPTTSNTTKPAPFRLQDIRGQFASDSDAESINSWEDEAISKHNSGNGDSLPNSLRVGPPVGYTPKTSQERLATTSTNPFLARQNTGSSSHVKESSADAWAAPEKQATPATAPPATAPPPPPPQDPTPLHQQFTALSVAESNTNPWQPHLDTPPSKPPLIPAMSRQDSGKDAWAPASKSAPTTPEPTEFLDMNAEQDSPAWDDDVPSPTVHEMPANRAAEVQQINNDRHAWDEDVGHPKPGQTSDAAMPQEGWNLVNHEPRAVGQQHSGVISSSDAVLERFTSEDHAPELPPRPSQEFPPTQPPRPALNTSQSSASLMGSSSQARKQKKETYEIKKIAWHDINYARNPRISPILVQNANGPCPLLALVNALTLSAPSNVEIALVEALRSREQVSLGLLLDLVIDELIRRSDAVQRLPDVSELYSFLVTLHTGMNVNPRFFPPPPTNSANDPRSSMSHVHPSEREGSIPGTFEDTKEMKLYSEFSIPLIHGWLPEAGSPAYAALKRTAQSYEDAQNMFFHEEELEDKLRREGLNFEEQSTLEDIATIKAFFASNATQLTPHGLDTITTSVAPGAVAILFRNDHFSTLYRHPNTLQLLQLVTDMGYAGHDEVVWETLIDVNGENAEFFSGDFRLVGGAPPTPSTSQPPSDGWTTATGQRQSQNVRSSYHTAHESASQQDPIPPQSPNTEQEDHDLALAMQLQEEEEERHRNEVSRRQRESELSRQYIEQQGHAQGNIPVSQRGGTARGRGGPASRGAGRGGGADLRPAIPPRRSGPAPAQQPQAADPEAGTDAPPPSYEMAANQAAYMPPTNHPAHPSSSPNGAVTGRRMSAYSTTANNPGTSVANLRPGRRGTGPPQGTLIEQIPGRRPTVPVQGQANPGEPKERDCIVM